MPDVQSRPDWVVWVDAWQQQCCGDPFGPGSRVTWTTTERPDRDWLGDVTGAGLAARVTHGEEHHGGGPEPIVPISGRVIRVRTVACDYGPDPEGPDPTISRPRPGTAVIDDVDWTDGRYTESGERRFVGYLVDLTED